MENIEKVEFTPLNISDEELADIPDCQFYVCEHDVLKNDGQIMHSRLQKLISHFTNLLEKTRCAGFV